MNNRRKLVIVLGAGAVVAPFASFAQQQGKVWRVGYLSLTGRNASGTGAIDAFVQGLRDLGYIEGKNLEFEWGFAGGNIEQLNVLAAEMVRRKVDVILGAGTPPTSAAQKATATISIVMASSNDPVGSGFVKSLARPGGNITGLSNFAGDLGPKHLELLIGMIPKLSRVAILLSPNNSGHPVILENTKRAAQKVGISIFPVEARRREDIEGAFSKIATAKAGALVIATDAFFNAHRHLIAEVAAKHRLPTIAANRVYPEAGGLMSYGQSIAENYRRAATYVDKIFNGAKPADLPVEQPTKFEMFINGKTAKTLGLKIPQSLLISADKVIE